MKNNHLYFVLILLFLVACEGESDDAFTPHQLDSNGNTSGDNQLPDSNGNGGVTPGNYNLSDWLIPIKEVRDGGPGKDGIPSIDNPKFITANEANFLNDSDLVIGIVNGNVARAYPHKILDWHEIVNDEVNGEFFTVNYCPLTGTAFGWTGYPGGPKLTYGVSGLIYNANLILYDRLTDSNWSQLRLECVNGSLITNKPVLIDVIETNWKTWKTLYPNSNVLSKNTGFSRNYSISPYGDYPVNNDYFIFRTSFLNDALPNKERVYAIIDEDKSKVFQFTKFNNGKAIIEKFNGKTYLVVGNNNLINSFILSGEYTHVGFEYAFNDSEVFFKDNEGNKWNIFGKAIEGPRTGDMLTPTKSVVSYWFAIAVFYPNPEIF